jgi:hypothetical protein
MVNIMKACMSIGTTILLSCTLVFSFALVQQAKDRVLVQLPFEPGRQAPVEIITIEVKGHVVEPGRKFSSGEDWLRGLSFTLKNISDKPVSYIEVDLRFSAPAGSQAENVGFDLTYGYLRVTPDLADDLSVPKSLMPGETLRLEMSEGDYRNLTGLLAHAGQSGEVETVKFELGAVRFENEPDAMWRLGYLLRRDANNPMKFNVSERYTLPKKQE